MTTTTARTCSTTTGTVPAVTTIRTRYATHPGSNVGDIVATARGGRTHRRHIEQSTSLEANHRAAAVTLAERLGYAGHTLELTPGTTPAGTDVAVWRVVPTWAGTVAATVHSYTAHHIGRTADADGWEHDAWRCVFRLESDTGPMLEVAWRAGTGHDGAAPTAADVLAGYIGDADAGDQSFPEFADDYGYDTDSIRARDTWEACRAAGVALASWAPADVLEALRVSLESARDGGEL